MQSNKTKILVFMKVQNIVLSDLDRTAPLQRLYLIINQMLRLILMVSVNGVDDYNSALLLVWECRSQ